MKLVRLLVVETNGMVTESFAEVAERFVAMANKRTKKTHTSRCKARQWTRC